MSELSVHKRRIYRRLSPDTNSPVDCLCLAKGRACNPARPARRVPQAQLTSMTQEVFMQHHSLQGKRVLITQADAFMGPVLCEVFAAHGAAVVAST